MRSDAGSADRPGLGGLRLIDHHCHGVVTRDLDRTDFEALLTEGNSAGPVGGSLFDSGIGFEVRRQCAPVLGLEPFAAPEEYLRRRAELGWREVSRRFLAGARLDALCVDTGFAPEPLTAPDELGRLAGGVPAHQVIRLETVAEDLVRAGVPAHAFAQRARARLAQLAPGAVAAKTVAAYRCGLDRIPVAKPGPAYVASAADGFVRRAGAKQPRLTDPVLIRFLIGVAVDLRLPLQVHTGFGDADLDLRAADPLHLSPLLHELAPTGVPVLLLHTYPFQRSAGYLAQVFENVFCDVGLAIPHTGRRSREVLAELLELAPFGKVLYSSDAFGLAELYYLGAALFRQALDLVVGDLELPPDEARRVARLIAGDNAARVYRLGR
jgi:uncharacterized protein